MKEPIWKKWKWKKLAFFKGSSISFENSKIPLEADEILILNGLETNSSLTASTPSHLSFLFTPNWGRKGQQSWLSPWGTEGVFSSTLITHFVFGWGNYPANWECISVISGWVQWQLSTGSARGLGKWIHFVSKMYSCGTSIWKMCLCFYSLLTGVYRTWCMWDPYFIEVLTIFHLPLLLVSFHSTEYIHSVREMKLEF